MLARIGVPFFFMISGYFLYSSNVKSMVKKLPRKIAHIFKLCVIYMAINTLYLIVLGIVTGSNTYINELVSTYSLNNLFDLLLFNRTIIGIGGWFLFALLYSYLIILLLLKHFPALLKIWLPIILLGIGFILSYGLHFAGITVPSWYYRNCYFDGLPFLLIGYFIRQNETKLNKVTSHRLRYIIPMAVLFGTLLSCFERLIIGGYDVYFGTIIIVFPCFLFGVFNSQKYYFSPLEKVGEKMTFFIYLLHPFAIYLITYVKEYTYLENNIVFSWLEPAIVVLISVLLSILIYIVVNICKRKTPKNRPSAS